MKPTSASPNKSVLIRKASLEDAPLLWQLKCEANQSTDFLMSHPSDPPPDLQSTELLIANLPPENFILLAFSNEKLVGFLSFGRSSIRKINHRVGLMMYVHSQYRGRGIGTKLVKSFLQDIRRVPGVTRVDLSVIEGNINAIRMYQKLGFTIEGRRDRAFRQIQGHFEAEVYMGLILSHPVQ